MQSVSRTPSTTPALSRALGSGSRSLSYTPHTTLSLRPQRNQSRNQNQYRSQTVRQKSDDGISLKSYGFEDITASLPSDSPSPPSSPQKNLILVDVREPVELTATGIIPSAICVPLASQPDALFLTPDEFETRFGFPKPGADRENRNTDIVFYCKAGVRARAAAQLAVQAGYDPDRIGVYDGSWLDWAEKGGKTEKWEGGDYE
ncbi:hypothetical protein EYZ11_001125 [Aspergillus tanneri]|nr:hypothetical protein EYZ11_001125 [Aspergillus tanneri]